MALLPILPVRIRFVDERGILTREAASALTALWSRTGGTTAPTNNELIQSDDDDSGLEEFKHENAKLFDGLASAPPAYVVQQVEEIETRLASLISHVAELRKELEDIKQGQMI